MTTRRKETIVEDDMPTDVSAAADGRLPCVLADVGAEPVLLLGPEVIEGMRGSAHWRRA